MSLESKKISFDKILTKTLQFEGGLRLHKNPTENFETYAGIYRKAHPDWEGWDYIDRGEDPPFELVRQFYRTHYFKHFEHLKYDVVKAILFDTAVNLGVKTAVKLAQKVLGLVPDGVIGPKTTNALDNIEDVEKFVLAYILARIAFYVNLANKNPRKYGLYLRGWLNRCLELLQWIYSVS